MWDEERILWSRIQDFYEFYKTNPVKMAPKLTPKHIYLPAFTAMTVKYATQITIAAAISTLSTLSHLPASASKTAKFIEQFYKLFNAFNSIFLTSSRPFRHALSNTSQHLEGKYIEESNNILPICAVQ